jgi:hypothetical protein
MLFLAIARCLKTFLVSPRTNALPATKGAAEMAGIRVTQSRRDLRDAPAVLLQETARFFISHTLNQFAIRKSMTMQAPLQRAHGNAHTPSSLLDRWITSRQQFPQRVFKAPYELSFIHQRHLFLGCA